MPGSKEKFPEAGEYVIAVVTKIFPYGAFVKLVEYPGKEGMIHISEISSKWIKNIRNYVKEDQRIVVKVLKIDMARGHIDLSLKSVKAVQKKQKIEEYKQEQKAEKLLELAAHKLKDQDGLEGIKEKILGSFDSLYEAFEEASRDPNALKDSKLPGKWAGELVKIAKDNIEIPLATKKVILELTTPSPEGINIIKNALLDAKKSVDPQITIDVRYVGAPNYKMEFTGPDFKTVEKALEKFSTEVISKVRASQGEGKLVK